MRSRVLIVIAVLACAKPAPPLAPLPKLSMACFVERVEPELQKSCAFVACHGAADRPLKLFSMAGVRGPYGPDDVFLSREEEEANFRRAIVYAAPTSSELPDLLRKPLQLEAGGAGHGGVDRFGRNVYASKDDPGYRALEEWVTNAPSCAAIGADAGVDAGVDAGTSDGGVPPGPTCAPRVTAPPNDWPSIRQYVNQPTCGADSKCHTPENFRDAGCFLADSCETVRAGGCTTRSVRPCNPLGSVLWRYSGAFRNHNSKFPVKGTVDIVTMIGEWIDGGASCDGGG